MSKLYINQKFYERMGKYDASRMLKLYNHRDRDSFFNSICSFLNHEYPFLHIDGFEMMSGEDASTYSMYNGFVSGNFDEYDEFLVSFSDPITKEGNTIISQQVMPMLQKRISDDLNFLYNKRIKRVFLLTSHKSTEMDATKNSIKENSRGSTLQLLVRCLVTLGFDVFSFIPIRNLTLGPRFKNIEELVSDIEYIRSQNSGNLQHKQFDFRNNTLYGTFSQKPKGQDEKYFAIRYLTGIILNNHNRYDVSQAYNMSDQTAMMEMLYRLSNHVQAHDIIYDSDKGMSDEEFKKLIIKEDDFLNKLQKLAAEYGEKGVRSVTSMVRLSEVQDELRRRLIQRHGQKCLLCDVSHNDLLIASHIKPASECDIYGKGDLENAFLLCAQHDRLFDKNLITFSFLDGSIKISSKLSENEIRSCNLDRNFKLDHELLSAKRIQYLMWHNDEFEKKEQED